MLPFKTAAKWAALVGGAVVITAVFSTLAGSAVAHTPAADGVAAAQLTALNSPSAATADAGRPGFADIIERSRAAVVTVSIEKHARGRRMQWDGESSPDMDQFLQRFFGRGMPSAPHARSPRAVRGMGSGFIIEADDGLIVTNNHVINGADEIVVTLDDGTEYSATVVGVDPKTDLALLRIDAEHLHAVEFGNSDAARVGDWVLAIGNPFGLGGTATVGIISARGRDIQSGPYDDYLQIDAPINQGNSGGPIFDTAGRVIGVNTAIYSPNGGNVGIGFAIPASQAEAVLRQLADTGVVERGWLGVQLQPLSDDIAESLELKSAHGALVVAVVPDSPAERGGIQVGDVITTFGSLPIDTAKALSRHVGATPPDTNVKLQVWRDGSDRTLRLTLGHGQGPAVARSPAASGEPAAASEPRVSGMRLVPLDNELRQRLRVAPDVTGVVVTGVDRDGQAAASGIRSGDIILRVGQVAVATPTEVAEAVSQQRRPDTKTVLLLIRRGDSQQFAALRLS